MRSLFRTILVLGPSVVVTSTSSLASATSLTFEYLGMPFNTFLGSFYEEGDRISSSITFESSLLDSNGSGVVIHNNSDPNPLVTEFSMSDGKRDFSAADANLIGWGLVLWVDEYQVQNWSLDISTTASDNMRSLNNPGDTDRIEDAFCIGLVYSECPGPYAVGQVLPFVPGVWTVVPEPSTGLLVIAGLLGLAGWRRVRA